MVDLGPFRRIGYTIRTLSGYPKTSCSCRPGAGMTLFRCGRLFAVSTLPLEVLHFAWAATSDEIPRAVGSLQTLRVLSLTGAAVTDAQLKSIVESQVRRRGGRCRTRRRSSRLLSRLPAAWEDGMNGINRMSVAGNALLGEAASSGKDQTEFRVSAPVSGPGRTGRTRRCRGDLLAGGHRDQSTIAATAPPVPGTGRTARPGIEQRATIDCDIPETTENRSRQIAPAVDR